MIVGVLTVELVIYTSSSLKEKRFVVKSIKDKLKNKFNVAIAEVDFLEKWQRAKLGIVTVGNEYSHVENSMQKIFVYLDNWNEFEIINHSIDYC
ncbi:MAG: DUF503 domain-containing protein [Calditrichia bacterium]|nr:DUF503 domain-containing protein [Calditrichia bacterium]